jgi:NAD(P)-dependent dehydrogenase (short-subunit alcohol dehydrogenase family)
MKRIMNFNRPLFGDHTMITPDQRIYKNENIHDNEQNVKPVSYSIIRHGILGLTKYLATHWPEKNVRCNAISPGGIYNGQNKDFLQKIQERIPIERMAKADEYQGAIIF